LQHRTSVCNTGKKHLQILQHLKISIETSWATYCNMEKKHLQILQHPKISIETSRGTYCNMGKRVSVADPQRAATRETLPPQQGSTGPRRAMRKPRRFRSSAPGLRCSSPPGSRRGIEELVRMRLPTAAPHEALTGAGSSLDGALTAARAELALLPRAGAPPARASPATPPGRGGHDDMAPGLGEQRAMLDRSAARAFASAPPPSSQHPLPCTGCIRGERERHGDGGWLFWGTEGMTVSQRYKANRGRVADPRGRIEVAVGKASDSFPASDTRSGALPKFF
jgi:hypothetical protein